MKEKLFWEEEEVAVFLSNGLNKCCFYVREVFWLLIKSSLCVFVT